MEIGLKYVTIYPADWYFNACVHGFLDVVSYGLGEKSVESFLQDDGTVKIPEDVFEAIFSKEDVPLDETYSNATVNAKVPSDIDIKRITWWWIEKTSELRKKQKNNKKNEGKENEDKTKKGSWSYLFSRNGSYANLIPQKNKQKHKEETVKLLDELLKIKTDNRDSAFSITCAFCGEQFFVREEQDFLRIFFNRVHSKWSSSLDAFPNTYWNNTWSMPICPRCRSYIIFFHIIESKGLFINTSSLKANWFINKILEKKFPASQKPKNTLSNLGVDMELIRSLSGWSLMGLDFLKFKGNQQIEYYSLSPRVAQWLLNPNISSYLNPPFYDSKDKKLINLWEKVWELVLTENMEGLPSHIHKLLKETIALEKDAENKKQIDQAAEKLINLYYTLRCTPDKNSGNRGGEIMEKVDVYSLIREGKNGPLNISSNAQRGLVYRILELARLGRKEEVFYMLLRLYVSEGKPFPERLSRLLELSDTSSFTAGIFAYLFGVTQSIAKEAEENEINKGV